MTKQVEEVTHGQEILDVVLTSDQHLVSHVEIDFFPTFTDHGVVTCGTTLSVGGRPGTKEKQFNQSILPLLEKLVPEKQKFQGRPKMSKHRKYLWCRLNKVKERLWCSTSARTITRLLKERHELERKLKQSYTHANMKEEKAAIPKIKQNLKGFFPAWPREDRRPRPRLALFRTPRLEN